MMPVPAFLPMAIGPVELLLLLVLVLMLFGAGRLPDVMQRLGRALGSLRRAASLESDENR